MLETPILTTLRQFRPWLPRGLVPPATPPVEETEPTAASEAPDLSQEAAGPAEPAPPTTAQRVIDHLQATGRLGQTDLNRAKRLGEEGVDPLVRMLVRLGLVSERDMAEAMAEVLGLELAEVESFPAEPVASETLSLRFLKDSKVLPLREEEDRLEVAFADPTDRFVVDVVALAAGKPLLQRVALPSEIDTALERLHEPKAEDKGDDLNADLGEVSEDDIEHLKDLASEAPVIRLVNQLIQKAVESRASDIHIEPFAEELKVRYRVDGILHEVPSPPVRSTAAIISRIKIMSKLNIAERRLPQDGRIPLRVQGKELDLRVSTVPTMFGESVVMRLLDKESVRFDLDALGFDGGPRARLDQIMEIPYGILLVTGPTGSGKSTTLYTVLSRLNTQERKIITVEDPVEYQIPGINQIQVKPAIGMTFSGALRSIVRQDPDIIMVGEMRDLETARIAVQSALTGHLVLSTLHTNDAASGVTRLLDMGVEEYLLTSTINGILAQRLVRRLCPFCRESYEPLPEVAAKVRKSLPDVDAIQLYRAVGCERCNSTGYRGRLVITEVLRMTDAIRRAVLEHATATVILRLAIEEGMATMYQDGLRKCLDGRTTLEEVLRVAEEH
ncbi:MAG: type II secretion system ATPase GspE [Chromatiaceae bacterium]|nr:type II secretion system ATPase GspE [Chromatiaceae bacterium]